MYTITLGNGRVLDGLSNPHGGDFFITEQEIHNGDFPPGTMRNVTIEHTASEDEGEDFIISPLVGEHEVLRFAGVIPNPLGEGYALCLAEYEPEVLEREKLKGDIAYLAMMSDIELD